MPCYPIGQRSFSEFLPVGGPTDEVEKSPPNKETRTHTYSLAQDICTSLLIGWTDQYT